MIAKAFAAAALLAATMTSALAGDFYVVGSLGRSSFDDDTKSTLDNELRAIPVANLSSSIDKNDTGYKLQFGYQYNANFAVEGGYVDLGKETYTATYTGGALNVTGKASGLNIAALGILPINDKFSVFGKLGMIDAKVKVSGTATGPGGTLTASDSATKWKPNYGIGAAYNFTKTVGMRVEYERFQKLGDNNTTGESSVNLLSAGVVVKF